MSTPIGNAYVKSAVDVARFIFSSGYRTPQTFSTYAHWTERMRAELFRRTRDSCKEAIKVESSEETRRKDTVAFSSTFDIRKVIIFLTNTSTFRCPGFTSVRVKITCRFCHLLAAISTNQGLSTHA